MRNHSRILTLALVALAIAACGEQQPEEPELPPDIAPSYAVGSSTFFIHDDTRPFDSVAGVDTGIRTLITEVWYPIDPKSMQHHRRAIYGDYVFGNRAMHTRMMTGTTFFHLTPDSVRDGVTQEQIDAAIEELFVRERGSYANAPLAAAPEKFPVVVMSHGDAGSRYNMESACEYLAAHGYIVIAAEHTGNSPFSMSGVDPALRSDTEYLQKMASVVELFDDYGAYGPVENFGQSYSPLLGDRNPVESLQMLDRSMLQRLNDLRAVLRKLDQLNADSDWQGRLDLEHIGLMGRSFGGATTLMGLAMEPRFTSGFAVVPPAWPDARTMLPKEALAAPGEESVLLAAEGPAPLAALVKPTLLLSGAEDTLIIGLAASQGAAATPENPHPVLRDMFETSEVPAVWGLLADSNHGSFGVSGPYWWPELKPDTQARHFAPDQTFELVSPSVAHRMQRELALAFFDLTIRQDKAALEHLKNNGFESQGLALEVRNF